MKKTNGKGIKRIINAFKCSIKGLKAAYIHETAFKQELLLTLMLLPFSFVIASSVNSWILLILSLLFLLLVEIMNSAVEALADQISMDHHELLGRAKDLGSAAVLLAMAIVVLVWSVEGYFFLLRF